MDKKELLQYLLGRDMESQTSGADIPTIKGKTYPKVSGLENIVEGMVKSGENRANKRFLKLPFSEENLIVSAGVNEPGHSRKDPYRYMDEEGNITLMPESTANLGIDLASGKKPGEKLKLGTAFPGEVVDVIKDNSSKYGKSIVVKTDMFEEVDGKMYPVYNRYSHLDKINVKKGDRLEVGQNIGVMGGSGKGKQDSYGVHLDFRPYIETEKGQTVEINPKRLFKKAEEFKGDIENYVMAPREHNPVLDMVNKANEEEASFQKTKYDNLPFKDAFEKAYSEKGEGETFMYQGKPILLKKAEPKVEEKPKRSFEELAKEYANLKTPVESGQSIEGDMPTEEEMNYVPEEETSMDNFDPRQMELQRLIDKGENLVNKYDTFKDGGRKYQDGSMYGPSDEELKGKKSFEELAREYASLKNPEEVPTPQEMNPVVEEKEPMVRDAGKSPNMLEQLEADAEYNAAEIASETPESPVEPSKPEAKPMTMADLESEYRKLMEASREERKTAQWATAATQIASMLDKFSARPVGIKPINFQAEQNPAAMQDLLNLGRLQNQGQLTPYQREMLKLTKDREETREKYFKANMDKESRIANQQQINTMRGFLKDDPTYKKIAEQRLEFDQVGDIIKQAESGNQNAIAALGTKLARAMGEVGVLTDTDVVRYVQGTSWGRQLKTWWEKGREGDLPQEVLEDIKANINTIDSKLKENEQRVFKRAAGRIKAAYPNVEDDMVYGVLGYKPSSEKEVSKTDKKSVEKNSLLEWLEKNPDHPKAEAVREKAKRQGLL